MAETGEKQAARAGKNGNVPPERTRWPKGTSGNPKGRPPRPYDEWLATADPVARERLDRLMKSKRAEVATRVATYIVDRAHGKPTERHEVSGTITLKWAKELGGDG